MSWWHCVITLYVPKVATYLRPYYYTCARGTGINSTKFEVHSISEIFRSMICDWLWLSIQNKKHIITSHMSFNNEGSKTPCRALQVLETVNITPKKTAKVQVPGDPQDCWLWRKPREQKAVRQAQAAVQAALSFVAHDHPELMLLNVSRMDNMSHGIDHKLQMETRDRDS